MANPGSTAPWSLHKDKYPLRHAITCEIEGKSYRGNYWVAGKILVVSTRMGGKSRQVGNILPEALAKQLLEFLAREGKA